VIFFRKRSTRTAAPAAAAAGGLLIGAAVAEMVERAEHEACFVRIERTAVNSVAGLTFVRATVARGKLEDGGRAGHAAFNEVRSRRSIVHFGGLSVAIPTAVWGRLHAECVRGRRSHEKYDHQCRTAHRKAFHHRHGTFRPISRQGDLRTVQILAWDG